MSFHNSVRLAVFDCDGTLVDSQRSIVAAMRTAFGEEGLARPSPQSVRRQVGLPLLGAIENLLEGGGANTHERLVDGYNKAFSTIRKNGEAHEPLFPGAVEVLKTLNDDGWLLGVATGKSRRGLVATLEGHGLLDFFMTLQTSDIPPGKPHPDMLFRAMDEAGAGASATVMVGDTTYDVEMAKSAGAMAIGVSWGYHGGHELRAAGARTVIDDFAHLPKIINSLVED
ncbi:MAG: HAD-IA family hydrolase [Rhodospirillales bacterium]